MFIMVNPHTAMMQLSGAEKENQLQGVFKVFQDPQTDGKMKQGPFLCIFPV